MEFENQEQFLDKLEEFGRSLAKRIYEKDPSVRVRADMISFPESIQYDKSAVWITITTDTSGVDRYAIWLEDKFARFVRIMG